MIDEAVAASEQRTGFRNAALANYMKSFGVLAIAPGKASIAVWSPGLDSNGNSHLGQIALEMLSQRLGWSIFGV